MEYSSKKKVVRTILIISAHPDDEVLGCGASIAKWAAAGHRVHILIMAEGITSRSQVRDRCAQSNELSLLSKSAYQAGDILGATSVKLLDFPDNRMDSVDLLDVIKAVEKEIDRLKPDTVVTHHNGDLNIDHRIVHEAVVTACRPLPGQTVLCLLAFEVPSSTEWQTVGLNMGFQPNWFEDVRSTIDLKIDALKVYEDEMRKWPHARSLQSVEYLAHRRGAIAGCDAAESFMLIRKINVKESI